MISKELPRCLLLSWMLLVWDRNGNGHVYRLNFDLNYIKFCTKNNFFKFKILYRHDQNLAG